MFKVYKNRNFNDLINDTFIFFRQEGKSYFSNYIKIAGGFILLFALLVYLLSNVFFENIFLTGSLQQEQMLENYFGNNEWYYAVFGIVCILVLLLISAINYLFPVVYFKLLADKVPITTKNIIKGIKARIWKVILFILFSSITFLPIGVILFAISGLLVLILIGIPLIIFVTALMVNWVSQSFYEYTTDRETGYFWSFGTGYTLVASKFWPNVGTSAIFLIVCYIIQTAITFIASTLSSFITMSSSEPNSFNQQETFSTLGIVLLITLIISSIIQFLMQNVIMINQGVIYYSNIEQRENNSLHDDIDLIGKDIE